MKKILFLLILSPLVLAAQTPADFFFTAGSEAKQIFVRDLMISDTGVLIAAGDRLTGGGQFDQKLYLGGFSQTGDSVFELVYGKNFGNECAGMTGWGPDHLAFIGHTEDSTGTFNVTVLKVSRSGQLIWDLTYGDNGKFEMDTPLTWQVDAAGNLLIGGSSGSSEIQRLLLKISSDGKLVSVNRFAPSGSASTTWVQEVGAEPDGAMLTLSFNPFRTDTNLVSLTRFSSSGKLNWERQFNGWISAGTSRQLLAMNGSIFTVFPENNQGASDALKWIRLDTTGQVLIHQILKIPGSGRFQELKALRSLGNGRILILTESFSSGRYFYESLITDQNGLVLWSDLSDAYSGPQKVKVSPAEVSGISVYWFGDRIRRHDLAVSEDGKVIKTVHPELIVQDWLSELAVSKSQVWGASLHFSSSSTVTHFYGYQVGTVLQSQDYPGQLGQFQVDPVYPNPFNPSTRIRYELDKPESVLIEVFDVTGRRVAVLADEVKPAGIWQTQFRPEALAAGLYFIRIQAGLRQKVLKAVYVK